MRILLFFCVVSMLFSACNTDKRLEVDTSTETVNVVSENLDQELLACKSVGDVSVFLNKRPHLLQIYFAESQTDANQLAAHLFSIIQNPDFQAFNSQLDSLIGDRKTTILNPLGEAFKQIKYHFPAFKIPKVQFISTGFTGNDLYISDSLIIIGLDYFGGPDARFRPDVFDYQLRRYQKDYIVPSIVFFESNQFNKMDPTDNSLLADMVGYGKGYAFVKQVMPNTPDNLILGYSPDNLRRTYASQRDIWAYFVSAKLLYEKVELRKKKFIEERPFTTEIGPKVPGAIARWLGWRIVNRFRAENPGITLAELMETDNAPRILQDSGYNGEPDEEE
ncbi:gliding motility protein [Dyadobacter sp. CY326]|uniref:gliding motility protein GldB-related protein n=1 Tax=Dyadobacter sp. CY326 TaxID=2907300 RepID=UPI001F1ACC19|nr:gliding motility protein [Dyadobacter sp. CY326]MCE7067668.1 gliding motility protein [Dyadobacter sp. CY326]